MGTRSDSFIHRIYGTDFRRAKHAAIRVMDKLQTKNKPEEIVSALGILFLAVCARFDVSPRRVLEAAERIKRDARDHYPRDHQMLVDYMENEWEVRT